MRKNGFTLIELLAVIVILAIIALIATPIILGIINDARKESQERSVELYASAVKNAIAAYQLREMKEVEAGSYTSEGLPFDVEYDGEVKCTRIDIYEDGGVYVEGCTVNDIEVDYTYGNKKLQPNEIGKLSSVCTPLEMQYFADSPLKPGYKYECKVDPNKEPYMFYVLNSTSTKVSLIMDSNINISGNAVKGEERDLGLVAWYADAGDNSYGPVTALEYLQTATQNWTNLKIMKLDSFSNEIHDINSSGKVYSSYSKLPGLIEDYSKDLNNAYLYDNLYFGGCTNVDGEDISCDGSEENDDVYIDGIYVVEGISNTNMEGYWTSSTSDYGEDLAYAVDYRGGSNSEQINVIHYGVRPVITLDI